MISEFCASALERALRCHGTPRIFNTDQGAQYTSHEFIEILKEKEIKISMDGKGRAMDNIFIERLWRNVKYEEIYINEFKSVDQLRKALKNILIFTTMNGRIKVLMDRPRLKCIMGKVN